MVESRIEIANRVLQCFADDTWLTVERGRVIVHWKRRNGEEFRRQWVTLRGQSFYPSWHRHWAHGGTSTTALSQLVRWVQDKPVLPLATWRYWCGETVQLARGLGPEAITLLAEAAYPDEVDCVLCHEPIRGGLDWWHLDGVEGPCCSYRSGCRQKRGATQESQVALSAK